MAERIALVPPTSRPTEPADVHRAMGVMGLRTAVRSGTSCAPLGVHQPTFPEPSSAMPASAGPSAVSAPMAGSY